MCDGILRIINIFFINQFTDCLLTLEKNGFFVQLFNLLKNFKKKKSMDLLSNLANFQSRFNIIQFMHFCRAHFITINI